MAPYGERLGLFSSKPGRRRLKTGLRGCVDEDEMRIVVNGMPALRRRTGVGSYTLNLLSGLARRPEVEALGVFNGLAVVPFNDLAIPLRGSENAPHVERLRRLLRRSVPFARVVAGRLRQGLFDRACRNGNWDAYHEPNYIPQRFRGPVVTTILDMCFMRHPEFLPDDRLRWLRRGFRRAVEDARRILTVSRFTREELLRLCPWVDETRVRVTHLAVSPRCVTSASNEEIAAVRARLKLPPRFILYVGTMEPRKNLQGLLKAFMLLPDELRRMHPLVLAGPSGWGERYFRDDLNKMRPSGLVREVGYLSETILPAVMRAATVLCFPSLYEGFGLPPLEAAACGTPVVCSRAASLPEVMGDAALYVDPRSAQDIATGLRRVLENEELQASLRRAGPRRAARFTWRKCAADTVAAYQEAIDSC